MYDAVIFDNDGVIVELTDRTLFRRAICDAFAALGVTDPPAEHVTALLFVDYDKVSATLDPIADTHDVDVDALWQARDEFAVTTQVDAAATGGKDPYEDVTYLDDLEVPLGVVSNNQHETVHQVLAHHGLDTYFDTMYGRDHSLDGLRQKKPNPYYLNQAIEDLEASNPLYVGDSMTDVLAAHRAGIDVAFLRRQHRHEYDLTLTPEYELQGLEGVADLINGSR